MSEIPGQISLPGFDHAPDSAEKPEPVSPTMPDENISEAYYDLGGHSYELTANQARAMHAAGLGGEKIVRQVARDDAGKYYQAEFNLMGPERPSDEHRAATERGMSLVARVLGPHEFDRASKEAAGDQTWLMAVQRARAERRGK